jgi:2-dehydropantoate 2-reductase
VTRIAIVGVGAVGATFGAAIEECVADAELTLCGRRDRRPRVSRAGRPPVALRTQVLTDPAQAPLCDWVLVAVKAHQTASVGAWLDALCGASTVVVVLQNGIDHESRVTGLLQGQAVLPVIIWFGARTVGAEIRIPEGPRVSVPATGSGNAFRGLLGPAWLTVDIVEDFVTEAWKKLCLNAVIGLTAVVGVTVEMFRLPSVESLMRAYVAECVTVAVADGASLSQSDVDDMCAHLTTLPAGSGSSILEDRVLGKELEWEARNAVVRDRGRLHGVPTPISDVVVPLLQAVNDRSSNRDRQKPDGQKEAGW